MKPCIVHAENESACVLADSLDDATQFAHNYFGDYRIDYRNPNHVEFQHSTEHGGMRYYHFSVTAHRSADR